MTRKTLGAAVGSVVLTALFLLIAVPASAQLGSLKGRVVDEAGNPVAEAEVTFEYSGEQKFRFTGKSNAKGEFIRAGLYSVGGRWTVSARKGNMAGFVTNIDVPLSATGEVGDIVIRAGGRVAEPNKGLSDEAAAEEAKQQAALKKIFDEANAALASNSYDAAIAKLNEAITKVQACTICYLRIGDVNVKKGDFGAAETAYKKAAEMDAKSAEAYDGLAIVYNQQKKFAEAGEASKKANELRSAGGTAGGDANSYFNAGVIFWNQSKAAEAAEQFDKAIKANPSMASAYYFLGMALLNQGKVPEAKTQLQQYLKLAPTGEHAETVKAILGSI
jgi:tetratricopeptide (TPR) repeat protein